MTPTLVTQEDTLEEPTDATRLVALYQLPPDERKRQIAEITAQLEAADAPDTAREAELREQIACLHHTQGRYPASVEACERSFVLSKQHYGLKHPLSLRRLRRLAAAYLADGYLLRAVSFARLAQEQIGDEAPRVTRADTAYLEGIVSFGVGNDSAAEASFFRALSFAEEGKNSETRLLRAAIQESLGEIYTWRWDFASAIPLLQTALAENEAILGQSHPLVAGICGKLTTAYWLSDDYDKAATFYARLETILIPALVSTHPYLAALPAHRLCLLVKKQKSVHDLVTLSDESLSQAEKAYRPNHPALTEFLSNAAYTRTIAGHSDREVEPLLLRALAIVTQELPDNPHCLAVFQQMAELRVRQEKHEEAKQWYRRNLDILERFLPPLDRRIGLHVTRLAELYQREGFHQTAEALWRWALLTTESRPELPATIPALLLLGQGHSLGQMGRWADAERAYSQAITLRESIFDQEAFPEMAWMPLPQLLSHLAVAQEKQGKYGEATATFERVIREQEEISLPDPALLAPWLNCTGVLYLDKLKNSVRAETLFERALTIHEKDLHFAEAAAAAMTAHNLAVALNCNHKNREAVEYEKLARLLREIDQTTQIPKS